MPGKDPYMKKGAYEMGHSPKQMNHPMKMNDSKPMQMSPYNMKPAVLRHMTHNK
jgi:hypothetical protein|tara:strand:+ start:561 stop:722 length:162 start_codon:yes stop_codon:yes gene_type:complete